MAEGSEVPGFQIECVQGASRQPIGDRLHQGPVDVADEANGQVQVGGGRPPELRRGGGARREEAGHGGALRFGHRQPEERPDYFRTGAFFQCCGTHELGEVGRHPK